MKRILTFVLALAMALSLAACGSQQVGTSAGSEAASTASSETASAAQTKTEEQLLAEENDILAANNALWEKVFASMDKNVTDTTLSSNYGDILMNALDHAKDQFTDEEYAALKADADKIREIETQIAALPQDEAASQSMTRTASTFPQFEGKDLDGNSVSSSLFADNAFTVVNFWFSGCKPFVAELGDLNALNQTLKKSFFLILLFIGFDYRSQGLQYFLYSLQEFRFRCVFLFDSCEYFINVSHFSNLLILLL